MIGKNRNQSSEENGLGFDQGADAKNDSAKQLRLVADDPRDSVLISEFRIIVPKSA
jgi:hypothetical protein